MGLVLGIIIGIIIAAFLVMTASMYGLTGVAVILAMFLICAIVGWKA